MMQKLGKIRHDIKKQIMSKSIIDVKKIHHHLKKYIMVSNSSDYMKKYVVMSKST